MNNASLILQTLDGHMDHSVRLILYGRAALQLGFNGAPADVADSKDVDAIIPLVDVDALSSDEGFWSAQEAANHELRAKGLYITHLFPADQVFLRRDWERHVLPLSRPPTRWLRLFRPGTLDLILTKMMRGDDPQDMADIRFLMDYDRINSSELEQAFADAVIPDLPELRDAFERAKPHVRGLVRRPTTPPA